MCFFFFSISLFNLFVSSRGMLKGLTSSMLARFKLNFLPIFHFLLTESMYHTTQFSLVFLILFVYMDASRTKITKSFTGILYIISTVVREMTIYITTLKPFRSKY